MTQIVPIVYIDDGKNTVKTGCLLGDWTDELGKGVWITLPNKIVLFDFFL
jgi:hypothetical protein